MMTNKARMLETIYEGYRVWIRKLDEAIAYANKIGYPVSDTYSSIRRQYFAESTKVLKELEEIWKEDRGAVSARLCEFFDSWNVA